MILSNKLFYIFIPCVSMKKICTIEKDDHLHEYKFPLIHPHRNKFSPSQPVVSIFPSKAYDLISSKIVFFIKDDIDEATGKTVQSVVIRQIEDSSESLLFSAFREFLFLFSCRRSAFSHRWNNERRNSKLHFYKANTAPTNEARNWRRK